MIYEGIDRWNSPSLEHYGIKGMKWGVRKARSVGSRIKSALARPKQRRYERSDYAKAKSMSNQELQQTINRINLEQGYINAMQRDRAAYKDATASVLSKWGKKTIGSIKRDSAIVYNTGEKVVRNAGINTLLMEYPMFKKPKI